MLKLEYVKKKKKMIVRNTFIIQSRAFSIPQLGFAMQKPAFGHMPTAKTQSDQGLTESKDTT